MGVPIRRFKCTKMTDAASPLALQLRFQVNGPGWLFADLHSSAQEARISASYLSDALRLLLVAVIRSSWDDVGLEAKWEEEPGYYRWEFSRRGALTVLRILHGGVLYSPESLVFEHIGETKDLQLAVVDACVELLDEIGEIRYFQEWGTPFPLDELQTLQRTAGLKLRPARTAEVKASLRFPLRKGIALRWDAVLHGSQRPEEAAAWADGMLRDGSYSKADTRGLQALVGLGTTGSSSASASSTDQHRKKERRSSNKHVRVTYDPVADAAYIYLVEDLADGMVARTHITEAVVPMTSVNLDYDHDGLLVGIEILGASRALSPKFFAEAELAERIDPR